MNDIYVTGRCSVNFCCMNDIYITGRCSVNFCLYERSLSIWLLYWGFNDVGTISIYDGSMYWEFVVV